jgi:RNA polymerase sigma-70 factor (ECF subfamily)
MGRDTTSWSSLSDEDLVARYRSDATDEAAFRELFRRYGRVTFGFFHRRVGDADWAADLNQDLHVRLLRSVRTYLGDCSWRTWVFVIARKVLAESRQARWRELAERSVALDEAAVGNDLSLPASAEDETEASLLRDRLKRCIAELDELSRAVVLDHYFQGVTLRELTERLGLANPSGSRAVLIAAQRLLRRCLGGKESRG